MLVLLLGDSLQRKIKQKLFLQKTIEASQQVFQKAEHLVSNAPWRTCSSSYLFKADLTKPNGISPQYKYGAFLQTCSSVKSQRWGSSRPEDAAAPAWCFQAPRTPCRRRAQATAPCHSLWPPARPGTVPWPSPCLEQQWQCDSVFPGSTATQEPPGEGAPSLKVPWWVWVENICKDQLLNRQKNSSGFYIVFLIISFRTVDFMAAWYVRNVLHTISTCEPHPTPPPCIFTNLYEVRTHNRHHFTHNSTVSVTPVGLTAEWIQCFTYADLIWWSVWAVKTNKVFGWAIYKTVAFFHRKRTVLSLQTLQKQKPRYIVNVWPHLDSSFIYCGFVLTLINQT